MTPAYLVAFKRCGCLSGASIDVDEPPGCAAFARHWIADREKRGMAVRRMTRGEYLGALRAAYCPSHRAMHEREEKGEVR